MATPYADDPIQGRLGRFWHKADDGRLVCNLCPRRCTLRPGQRGFCYVRGADDQGIVLTTYGRSSGFCIDPIEKKPLNHFYPGTSVLSFGTAGCNLACKFCQNWDISKARSFDRLQATAGPDAIAKAAAEAGCTSVAFTYNDPIIFAEYAIDTAQACRARGLHTVAVTAGYITDEARPEFFEAMDAANIDLKAFTEQFYQKLCLASLKPVLDTIDYVANRTSCWVELTTLLIPGKNDGDEEIRAMSRWLLDHVGPDVPLHFSAFHPDYRMNDIEATPVATLSRARLIAKDVGLNYVYTGNVHDTEGGSTRCARCDHLLIERDWYELGSYGLSGSSCGACGATLPGAFGEKPGSWGRKRARVIIR